MRLGKDYRHWNHWRALKRLTDDKYARVMHWWKVLYGVRPRGIETDGTFWRLHFEKVPR